MVIKTIAEIGIYIAIGVIIGMVTAWLKHLHNIDDD